MPPEPENLNLLQLALLQQQFNTHLADCERDRKDTKDKFDAIEKTSDRIFTKLESFDAKLWALITAVILAIIVAIVAQVLGVKG